MQAINHQSWMSWRKIFKVCYIFQSPVFVGTKEPVFGDWSYVDYSAEMLLIIKKQIGQNVKKYIAWMIYDVLLSINYTCYGKRWGIVNVLQVSDCHIPLFQSK